MSGFGIYLHWPYCARICPYCDFNVYRQRDDDVAALIAAIKNDLRAQRARFPHLPAALSLHFGGGTPSLLSASQIAELIEHVDVTFGLAPDAEITLEANPEDRARFGEQVRAGVTRLSLGVQALEDCALKALGRMHDAAAARAALAAAAATGARVSADLIYAREGQSVRDWRSELQIALAQPVEHLSLYQLTIEAGTAFAQAVARGTLTPPDVELAASLYEETQALCDAAGFPAYEISNHARGAAAQSKHNLLYWRSGDWLGVGPGAHGRVSDGEGVRWATRAALRPADYVAGVGGESVALTVAEVGVERVLMGLRLAEGLEVENLDTAKLALIEREGLLRTIGNKVALTPSGRLVADRVARELAE